jgi:hypothetical protein
MYYTCSLWACDSYEGRPVSPTGTDPTVWPAGTQPSAIRDHDDDALVFTMRDLNLQTACQSPECYGHFAGASGRWACCSLRSTGHVPTSILTQLPLPAFI